MLLEHPDAKATIIGASDSDSRTSLVDTEGKEADRSRMTFRNNGSQNLTWCYDALTQTSGIYEHDSVAVHDLFYAQDGSIDLRSASSVHMDCESGSALVSQNFGR